MPPTVAYYYDEEIGELVFGRAARGIRKKREKKKRQIAGKPMFVDAGSKQGRGEHAMILFFARALCFAAVDRVVSRSAD